MAAVAIVSTVGVMLIPKVSKNEDGQPAKPFQIMCALINFSYYVLPGFLYWRLPFRGRYTAAITMEPETVEVKEPAELPRARPRVRSNSVPGSLRFRDNAPPARTERDAPESALQRGGVNALALK